MRIGLLSDIHANLPALEAAFERLTREGCDIIVNLGDAISIGPFPAETVQFLRDHDISSIAGNHENDLVLGFTAESERQMGQGEREHYRWTHGRLSSADVAFISKLPHTLDLPADAPRIHCVHYCLSGSRVADIKIDLGRPSLERAFGTEHEIVAFGHTHRALIDREKPPYFINPGSAGLHHTGGPSVMIVDIREGREVDFRILPVEYDHRLVLSELKRRAVPDHEFIRETFFGTGCQVCREVR
ncbi:MAG: metallophosphoesterase family protein [Spirochaetaceae bacterium]|nr:metallophosphoesterase family protein [Spirochaetaceae bacterium]